MNHEPSAIASVLRPPRSGKSEMRALPWVLACARRALLYALPSYAREPGPASSNAGAPDAAAPSQPGPPATAVAGLAPGSKTAASAASNESGEIEVTSSRKRVEPVQETPAAVSVVGPRQLNGAQGAKIHNRDDLSGAVPSFTIDAQQTSVGLVALSMRGISFTNDQQSVDRPAGVVIDGVDVGSNSGINFQNSNLQSIAVLRCPLEPSQNALGHS
jgi:outer membrane receptor protein involved in Fe transport